MLTPVKTLPTDGLLLIFSGRYWSYLTYFPIPTIRFPAPIARSVSAQYDSRTTILSTGLLKTIFLPLKSVTIIGFTFDVLVVVVVCGGVVVVVDVLVCLTVFIDVCGAVFVGLFIYV